MEKEFVPYDRALRLKELGFDEPCFGRWWFRADMHRVNEEKLEIIRSNYFELPEYYILAPTFSQAFRWFREKHSLYSAVIPYNPKKDYYECVVRGIEEEDEDDDWEVNDTYGYSEAEIACLDKLIEIVESKQKEDGK